MRNKMNRFTVLFLNSIFLQSFYYSYFTVICLIILIISQVPYMWSFNVIYAVIPFLMGVRPLGLAIYNLVNFLKVLKLSFPKGLPWVWLSAMITPFMFLGEVSSQMLRPVTLILRLLVNLSFAYLVSLTLGSQFIECLISFNIGKGLLFFFFFSVFYFFYEIFMSFLLTYVSHVMLLSLISDMHHVINTRLY